MVTGSDKAEALNCENAERVTGIEPALSAWEAHTVGVSDVQDRIKLLVRRVRPYTEMHL